eukprot:2690572-Prorocentrum_lima.AAC.1
MLQPTCSLPSPTCTSCSVGSFSTPASPGRVLAASVENYLEQDFTSRLPASPGRVPTTSFSTSLEKDF